MQVKPFAVIFGASSLVGRYLMQELAQRGFEGLCLKRGGKAPPFAAPSGFSWQAAPQEGALNVPLAAVLLSLVPITALPDLISRTRGGGRLVALSSSSVIFKAGSSDPAERELARQMKEAEEKVQLLCQARKIKWTILRPTLIYDPGHDHNVSAIAAFIRRFGFFPIVRPGTGKRQPLHAEDAARVMLAVLKAADTEQALLNLPGGETLSYREMVRRIFESLDKRPILIHLPLTLARMGFRLWRTLTGAGYSVASLERMNMDLALDSAASQSIEPIVGCKRRPFRPEFPESFECSEFSPQPRTRD